MIVREKNRLEKMSGQTKPWGEESLNFLLDQCQTVVDAMTACLKADTDLGRKAEVLMSLKGISLRTACFILAALPELRRIDKRQIAKMVGVAPLNRDSGLMHSKRIIAGGRRHLRDALSAFLRTKVHAQWAQPLCSDHCGVACTTMTKRSERSLTFWPQMYKP
ncbi:transposase [Brucella sp. 10RB9213]|uniref:transposase n=1 Tax=Brucella sp. 10RB9213 TaxID=1844039 RepID=UPI0012ADF090|nr:transposase [Brucella sp. 10RB9213]MRN67103.1 transposase [Brucella sp. 10RB9213]